MTPSLASSSDVLASTTNSHAPWLKITRRCVYALTITTIINAHTHTCVEGADMSTYNSNGYVPSTNVKYYRKNQFPRDLSSGNQSVTEVLDPYVRKTAEEAGVVLVLGLILFIWLCIWSCGMCGCCNHKGEVRAGTYEERRCCCGICCADPPKFMHDPDTDCRCGLIFWVMLLCFLGLVGILTIAALANEGTLDEEFDDFGSVLDILVEWSDVASTGVGATVTKAGSIGTTGAQYTEHNFSFPELNSAAQTTGSAISSSMAAVKTITDSINATISATSADIRSYNDDIKEGLSEFNDYRHTFCIYLGAALVLFIAINAIAILLKAKFPQSCGRRTCFWGCWSGCYMTFLLLVIVITWLLYTTVILGADFCYTADESFVGVTKLEGHTFEYFAKCDHDCVNGTAISTKPAQDECLARSQANNPFGEDVASITATVQLMKADIQKVDISIVKSCTSRGWAASNTNTSGINVTGLTSSDGSALTVAELASDCNHMSTVNSAAVVGVDALEVSLVSANTTAGSGNVTSGLFSNIDCAAVNKRYQAVMNQFCTSVYDPLARMFEILLVTWMIMGIVDVLRRILRPTIEQQRSDTEAALTMQNKVVPMENGSPPTPPPTGHQVRK